MTKEITIFFADDNLLNKQAKIVAKFGAVAFHSVSVTIERTGYDKEFLDYTLYCDDIRGGYNNGKTFVNIPDTKIISIAINEK
nr:MAG TPA: hypothetical protein [Caudoviricetes sp.]